MKRFLRSRFYVTAKLIAPLLLVMATTGVRGAEIPPPTSLVFLQTNGPNNAISNGDWYTSTAAGGGNTYHYFEIYVPCGWPATEPIYVDLFSPEMNSNNPALDEVAGTPDDTRFEIYAPGTAADYLNAVPGPGDPGSLSSTIYDPSSAPETWIRFHTLAAPVACGTYILRVDTIGDDINNDFPEDDDQNAWRLRVGTDNDADPTNAPPANSDDFDGIAGTNDEIFIGLIQASYQHNVSAPATPAEQCVTQYNLVGANQPAITLHNFDMDGNLRVRYYPPGTTIDPAAQSGGIVGTVSGGTAWNNSADTTRVGDTINNPEQGVWGIVTCVNANNQFIQEGISGEPLFLDPAPGFPQFSINKDDGRTGIDTGDTLTYTIDFTNISDTTPNPGAALAAIIVDPVPAGTTFVGCTINPPLDGAGSACGESGGIVTYTLDPNQINAGASGSVTLTVEVTDSPPGVVTNTATLQYTDFLGNALEATGTDINGPVNVVEGTVYVDADGDGIHDPSEFGQPGVTVELQDGACTPGADCSTTITDANGEYRFEAIFSGAPQNFTVVTLFPGTYPMGASLTTDNVETANFASGGNTDSGNDFGFSLPLSITKTSSLVTDVGPPSTSGEVSPGDVIEYTITVTNTTGVTQSDIVVSDVLPAGVGYADPSTVATGPTGAGGSDTYRDEFTNIAYDGTNGTIDWSSTPWVETDDSGGGASGGLIRVVSSGNCTSGNCLRFQIDTTNDNIERAVDLSGVSSATLTYDFVSTLGGGAVIRLDVFDGSTWQTGIRTYNSSGSGSENIPLNPSWLNANTKIRFFGPSTGGGFLWIDDVQIEIPGGASVIGTKDNIPASGNPALDDGVPPNLVVGAADGFHLDPAGSTDGGGNPTDEMTVTFRVQVNDPLSPFVASIVNTASASSDATGPVQASVIDPVNAGGVIGDRVWLDSDGDGVQDVGEPGLAGVTLELRDSVCTPGSTCPTAVSDTSGSYTFAHLAPGTYTVFVVAGVPGGLIGSPGNLGSNGPIVITSTEAVTNADFGYVPNPGKAVIGDRLWSDADSDGLQDPGEPGIANVTVELVGAGADGLFGTGDDVIVATSVTGADGSYRFTDVDPAEYIVRVDSADPDLAGFAPTSGPHSEGGFQSGPVTVAADEMLLDVDFGFNDPVRHAITNAVWYDADNDGIRDIGETGLSGVTVSLLNGAGDVIAEASSDGNGDVVFSGVADGSYTLQVSDDNGVVRNLTGTTTAAQAGQLAVTVSGGDVTGLDFGYDAAGAIGDRVWNDADGDGLQDTGELGIGGVLVNLVDPLTSTILATATTAADGTYRFVGFEPGTYGVELDASNFAPGGSLELFTQTGDPDEPGVCVTCDNAGTAAVTTARSSVIDMDFGYQNSVLLDVAGNVFDDLDLDGVDDGAGEPGLAGVTIELRDNGGNLLATTTTDANGDYVYADVPDGAYTIVVTDANGVLNGYRLTSGLDARAITVDAAADAGDGAADGVVSGNDFGYARDAQGGSIGDRVWLDDDGDGLAGPSESGLSGVTVDLYLDVDGDGVFEPGGDDGATIATTTTDATGQYRFSGLAAGQYFVDVVEATLPAGLQETAYTGTNPNDRIALSEGEAFSDADFGYVPSGATALLGDRVWYDADGDGLENPGEVGIGGVDVVVLDQATATTVIATTTTAADGSWLVSVPPGDYIVRIDEADLPAGYDPQPTNMVAGDDQYLLTVVAGDVVTHLDFGYNLDPAAPDPQGSIGDTVYLDGNGSGTQDGEPGIPGVTVNLIDLGADGNPGGGDDVLVATTVTDANGNYDFVGLPAGNYQVVVTDLAGVLTGLNVTQTPPVTITLAAGQDFDGADAGYAPSAGTGTIGDVVWHDRNGDGVKDAGEAGLEGVTLEVWLDVDNDGIVTGGTDNLVRTVVTDSNGIYEANGLPAGDYIVRVTDANGVLGGFVQTGDPDEPGVPCTVCDGLGDVTLVGSSFDQDFGYQANTASAFAISGTVFDDQNNNGDTVPTQEAGEPGIAGVVVSLYRLVNGQRLFFGSAVTDANGDYSFTDLPPGDYALEVDTSGTSIEDYEQTTQGGSGGVQAVTLSTASVADQDFGFYDNAVVTNPVTLRSFHALPGPNAGDVEFRWSTGTETGNVGFNLYSKHRGIWRKVNAEPIPSPVGDSVTVQRYRYQAFGVQGKRFVLEDVDINGKATLHGPFVLGKRYGARRAERKQTDWGAIRAQHESKKRWRKARQRQRMRHRVRRVRQELLSSWEAPLVQRAWSLVEAVLMRTAWAAETPDSAEALVNFAVPATGVYRVTYAELAAVGVDLAGIKHWRLALTNRGRSVPIRVKGQDAQWGSKTYFGPGGWIEFVGEGIETLYTKTNVYTLRVDRSRRARVVNNRDRVPRGAVPAAYYTETVQVEDQALYTFAAPNGDPWYAARMLAWGGPYQRDFNVELDGYVPVAPVTVSVGLVGVTNWPRNPDHHVQVDFNGQRIADAWFDGLVDHPVSAQVPASGVQDGVNILSIALPLDTGAAFDLVNLDHYSVTYPRRFMARDGKLTFTAAGEVFRVDGLPSRHVVVYRENPDGGVERLTRLVKHGAGDAVSVAFRGSSEAATYYVSTVAGLPSPALSLPRPPADLTGGPAEYLVVAHPDFITPELELLVQARRGRFTVKVVDVEDVYAQFGHYVVGAQAIRDYIAYAHRELGTRYVLLVGGDTYDYHDYLGVGAVSFIPSWYARTDSIVWFAPVDAKYADVDDDNLPDLAIGRFPVRTAGELEVLVNQTLAYDFKDYGGTAVFAADKYDVAQRYSFTRDSDAVMARLPAGWRVSRAHMDELGLAQARETLLDAINGGVAVTSFFGHSGPSEWSFDGLFRARDVDALTNLGRPTVVTQWGCWNTYYVSPSEDTLGHEFMLSGARGAAAVLGAAVLTQAHSERRLAEELFARMFVPGKTLGEAVLEAKRAFAKHHPEALDVILGWTQLGDPALTIQAQ